MIIFYLELRIQTISFHSLYHFNSLLKAIYGQVDFVKTLSGTQTLSRICNRAQNKSFLFLYFAIDLTADCNKLPLVLLSYSLYVSFCLS